MQAGEEEEELDKLEEEKKKEEGKKKEEEEVKEKEEKKEKEEMKKEEEKEVEEKRKAAICSKVSPSGSRSPFEQLTNSPPPPSSFQDFQHQLLQRSTLSKSRKTSALLTRQFQLSFC